MVEEHIHVGNTIDPPPTHRYARVGGDVKMLTL